MTVKDFDSLIMRDFENAAVRAAIRMALKEREEYRRPSSTPTPCKCCHFESNVPSGCEYPACSAVSLWHHFMGKRLPAPPEGEKGGA